MRVSTGRFRFLLLFMALLPPFGCVNIEREKRPTDWSQLASIADLKDLEGLYENEGSRTGGNDPDLPMGELWYFLTREKVACSRDAKVRISAIGTTALELELIGCENGRSTPINLTEGSDFSLRDGTVLLPSASGVSAGPMGAGFGAMLCRLHLSEDGGLTGELTGAATGVCLYVIPAIGFGKDWNYWRKVGSAQQAD